MRRARIRTAVTPGPSAPAQLTQQQITSQTLDKMSQDIKLIDIKRRVIKTNTFRLPFLYVGLGVFGFFLLGAIFALSIIMCFIFGTIFSAIFANTFGPIGALERRKSAGKEIENLIAQVGEALSSLPDNVQPKLFGFCYATKKDLKLTDACIDMKTMQMSLFDAKGALPLGPYKSLGMVFRAPDGEIDLKHSAMKTQYWLTEARLAGIKDDQIVDALAQYG